MFRKLILITATMLTFCQEVKAEVEEVIIKWTPMQCQASCVRGLEQQFRRIPGISSIDISQSQGQATLKWDQKIPFSYRALEAAMAAIGLGVNDLRVTARGRITHDERNTILTSIGDNTRFHLIGGVQMASNQHVELNSPFNRSLTPQLRTQLLEAERNQQIVTISGPLFLPETSPPLMLIVQSMSVSENSTPQTNR